MVTPGIVASDIMMVSSRASGNSEITDGVFASAFDRLASKKLMTIGKQSADAELCSGAQENLYGW